MKFSMNKLIFVIIFLFFYYFYEDPHRLKSESNQIEIIADSKSKQKSNQINLLEVLAIPEVLFFLNLLMFESSKFSLLHCSIIHPDMIRCSYIQVLTCIKEVFGPNYESNLVVLKERTLLMLQVFSPSAFFGLFIALMTLLFMFFFSSFFQPIL